jgi:polyphosphate kinase
MPRNFVRRVEIMFPIEEPALRDRLVDEILGTMLKDTDKAWRLLPDGSYERLNLTAEAACRSQQQFIATARERALAAEAAGAPVSGYRARAVPARARGPAPEAIWHLAAPDAPPGSDRLAS